MLLKEDIGRLAACAQIAETNAENRVSAARKSRRVPHFLCLSGSAVQWFQLVYMHLQVDSRTYAYVVIIYVYMRKLYVY